METATDDERKSIGQRFFDTTPDLILVVDRRGLILHVSPSSLHLLGYEPTEMRGHSATDFLYPPDLNATRAEMRAAQSGRQTRRFECRYAHKNGRVVRLNWTGVWSEEEQRHYFIGRDETEVAELRGIESELHGISDGLNRVHIWRLVMQMFDVRTIEYLMGTSSTWAGYVLFSPPSNSIAFPSSFSIAALLQHSEHIWDVLAIFAGLLGITGIILTLFGVSYGRILRVAGLTLASVFWTSMGFITLFGDPLFSSLGMTSGIFAALAAVRIAR